MVSTLEHCGGQQNLVLPSFQNITLFLGTLNSPTGVGGKLAWE
jgi:hypothetical protein